MARNFPGTSQAKLEEWLDELNEELATGTTITGTSSMDQSVSFQTRGHARGRQTKIIEDLITLDPAEYSEDDLPTTRTSGRFFQREY